MPRKRLPDLPGINKLSHEYKQFLAYLNGSDSEQYDIVRDRWARLNWALLDKADEAVAGLAKGESPAKVSPLIISAGIGFDKLYSKRSEQSKPLSFPPPLLEMVRKGLRPQSSVPARKQSAQAEEQAQAQAGTENAKSLSISERGDSESLPEVSEINTFGNRSADKNDYVNSRNEATCLDTPKEPGRECSLDESVREIAAPGAGQPDSGVVGSATGGVACADPETVRRGHGPTPSRQAQSLPDISQNQKKRVRPKRTPAQAAKVVARDKALRHEKKAKREAMIDAMRERVRREIPYQRPPMPGGVV